MRNGILFLAVFLCLQLRAQKDIETQHLLWYGSWFTIKFNEKWYWQTEIQERHYVRPFAQHQFLVRTHLHRNLGKSGWDVSVGFCTFNQSPNNPDTRPRLLVPELRPHVELGYKQALKAVNIDHRFRAEARFFHNTNATRTELEDGFDFGNFRFRYRLQATFPLWKFKERQSLKLRISDEIHINAGKKIIRNVFDQNRLYGGLAVDILPNLTAEAGYLYWFQMQPNGAFFARHIGRFSFFYTFDLQAHRAKHAASTK